MSWFDEQIEYRKKRERELLADSFENVAHSLTGGRIGSVFDENASSSNIFGFRKKMYLRR